MSIAVFFKRELSIFKIYNRLQLIFNIILFLWILTIPAKNSFYQISVVLIPLIAIIQAIETINATRFTIFFSKYSDLIIAFTMIIISMILSNLLGGLTTLANWSSILKFFTRYFLVLLSLLFLFEKKYFTTTTMIVFILASSSFYGLHGVYEAIITKGTTRVHSFIYNSNPFGLVMMTGVMTTTLCLIYGYKNKIGKTLSLCLFLLLTILSISLIYSGSRSAWISTLIFFISIVFINKDIAFEHKKISALLILVIISTLYFNNFLLQRLITLISFSEPSRFAIWNNALELISKKLFFGYGMVNYESIGIERYHGVHNSFLEILLYTGIFGLFAFTILACVITREILKTQRYNLISIFISLIVISQFNLSIFGNKIYLSILTILLFVTFSARNDPGHSSIATTI